MKIEKSIQKVSKKAEVKVRATKDMVTAQFVANYKGEIRISANGTLELTENEFNSLVREIHSASHDAFVLTLS